MRAYDAAGIGRKHEGNRNRRRLISFVFRRQDTAEYGDKVLALIGNEATVKTYRPRSDGKIVLHP